MFWDFWLLLIIISQILYFPFCLAFLHESGSRDHASIQIFLEMIPTVFLLLDILVNLNKGVYKDGNIIIDRTYIMATYIKQNFLIDLLCVLSINLKVDILKVFFLFRLR